VIDPFAFDPPETLATPRLTLRLPEVEDAEDLLDVITHSAEHLRPFIDWAALDYELDEVERRIRKTRSFFAQRDSFEWLLWANHGADERTLGSGVAPEASQLTSRTARPVPDEAFYDTRIVGAVDLHSFNWSLRRAEFGFWTTADGQGHGYIVEAARAVLAWASPLFTRIEARCDVRNQRSRRTLERLGFQLEGTLRRNIRDTAGQPADEHVFALLPELADEES